MPVLSVQSHVAYGHVGNSAAVFALQSLGVETWPVNTVRFSNHPGHGGFRGAVEAPKTLRDLFRGIGDRGVFPRCRAFLSGYLGQAANGDAVLEALARVRQTNADCLFLCDPVIGDRGKGIYVAADLVDFYRDRALPVCDVAIPNAFELEVLTGRPADRPETAARAAAALRERGPQTVIVTSVVDGPDSIANLIVTGGGLRCVTTPRLATSVKGGGDLLAALWLGRYLASGDAVEALARATAGVFDLLEKSIELAVDELPLVDERNSLTYPRAAVTVRGLETE